MGFANHIQIQAGQINQNWNDIFVGASVQLCAGITDISGNPHYSHFVDGRQITRIAPGGVAYTEPVALPVNAGQILAVNTYVHAILLPAPSAPTLATATTGGFLVASSTYALIVAYVFADGAESYTSSTATITVGATGTNTITVTSPGASNGAVGYRVYMAGRNAAVNTSTLYGPTGQGMTPIGVSAVIAFEKSNFTKIFRRSDAYAGIPWVGLSGGGGNFSGNGSYEGQTTGDVRDSLNVNFTPNLNQQYNPSLILSRPRLSMVKANARAPVTLSLIGDSIMAGTGDHGWVPGRGGFAVRAACNQLTKIFNPALTPAFAHNRSAAGGDKALQYGETSNTSQYERSHVELAGFGSTVICNYGTNDLSSGLSAMQTAILQIASWHLRKGQAFYQCTLFPKTASTNGFLTASNQTTGGSFETVRVNFNSWLRDGSAAGFVAQAAASAGVSASLIGVIDVCKYTEVNASNVLTLNGGFWRIPSTTPLLTGTLTSVAASYQFTDGAKSMTAQTYAGYNFLMTSGVAAPSASVVGQGCISWNNATTFNTNNSSIGATPAVGDAYAICSLSTIDGTHPSTTGHIWAAQAVIDVSASFV